MCYDEHFVWPSILPVGPCLPRLTGVPDSDRETGHYYHYYTTTHDDYTTTHHHYTTAHNNNDKDHDNNNNTYNHHDSSGAKCTWPQKIRHMPENRVGGLAESPTVQR